LFLNKDDLRSSSSSSYPTEKPLAPRLSILDFGPLALEALEIFSDKEKAG
jgi:hypothetical protein